MRFLFSVQIHFNPILDIICPFKDSKVECNWNEVALNEQEASEGKATMSHAHSNKMPWIMGCFFILFYLFIIKLNMIPS